MVISSQSLFTTKTFFILALKRTFDILWNTAVLRCINRITRALGKIDAICPFYRLTLLQLVNSPINPCISSKRPSPTVFVFPPLYSSLEGVGRGF